MIFFMFELIFCKEILRAYLVLIRLRDNLKIASKPETKSYVPHIFLECVHNFSLFLLLSGKGYKRPL